MKYLVTIFAFCLSLSSFAQLLNIEPIALPTSLSVLEFPNFQNRLTSINDLKKDIKPYIFTNDELDRMRNGSIFIYPKGLNKNATFSEPTTIDLKKELREIMYKIPGQDGIVRPKGFTL